MDSKRLLVIEDDETISDVLAYNLRAMGHEVTCAVDGRTGLQMAAATDVDLVVVDLMLPELNGMAIAKELSESKPHVPIIMITARTERELMTLGYSHGVDDFVVKPFDLDDLLARVTARLRRSTDTPASTEASVGMDGLELDFDTHTVTGPLGCARLKPKECELLRLLMGQPGRLFRKEEIMLRVWQQPLMPSSRTIDVHVRYVRAKLEAIGSEVTIHNVRGVGYRMGPVAEA